MLESRNQVEKQISFGTNLMWYGKTRVTSCELRDTSYKLQVARCELRVKSSNLRVTSSSPRESLNQWKVN